MKYDFGSTNEITKKYISNIGTTLNKENIPITISETVTTIASKDRSLEEIKL